MGGAGARAGAWAVRAVLIVVAVLATFGIGFFAGRELSRPASSPGAFTMQEPLSAVAKTAPELLRYRLSRSFTVDLRIPRGIACGEDGTVWVCGDRALLALTPAGAEKARFTLEGEPQCVAAGPDGRIFLGMEDHVEVFDPARGTAEPWPDLGSQAIVTSVAAGPVGVFVADAGNKEVLRFDLGGKLVARVGDGFVVPSPFFDVAASPDGTLWAANPGDQSVRHYDAKGALLATWGRASFDVDGFAGCCNPAHIARLPCGRIVTSEKGLLRIKVYEPDGKLCAVVAIQRDFPAAEKGLDIATRKANGGEILVLVPSERTVRVYAGKESSKGRSSGG